MSDKKNPYLPNNPVEAQGLLVKAFYEKFGKDALPIIEDICGRQGHALGLKIKKRLPDNKLTSIANAFIKSFDSDSVKIISLSDVKFQVRGTRCPFGLENTSKILCGAVMAIDYEYFRTAVSDRITMKIVKTMADGDSYCETIYLLDES